MIAEKSKITLTVVLIGLLTLFAPFFVDNVSAGTSPTVTITGPTNGAIYGNSQITVKCHVQLGFPDRSIQESRRVLDLAFRVDNVEVFNGSMLLEKYPDATYYDHNLDLKLCNGKHTIEVIAQILYAHYGDGEFWATFARESDSDVVEVTVDSGVAPIITLDNTLITEKNATLTLITNFDDCQISYSLDNKQSVAVPNSMLTKNETTYYYNIQLSDLADGSHSVKATITDKSGLSGTTQRTFTIGGTSIWSTSLLTIILTSLIVTTILVAVALLFYKKHQSKQKRDLDNYPSSSCNILKNEVLF